ncbi:MAG: DUF2442 domain-containing protein [Planctomycetes bacterium]|jgi:hypothetical protein|nr:DUF2442 domain-containing protein [Planctomycetota bacterium]
MKPVRVEALEGFRLRVRFADGTEGVADLGRFAHRGVFRLWDEPGAFDRVSVGPSGEIQWSEDVALCSDALYLTISGKAVEEVFPTLGEATLRA